jgi:FlaA1/EpsC-like NDP-sugar epimerase
MLVDIAILVISLAILTTARYDLALSQINREGLGAAILLAAAVYTVTYGLLVSQRYHWGSPDEAVGLMVVAIFLVAALSSVSVLTRPALVPLSVAITTAPCAAVGWLIVRAMAVRFHRARLRRQGQRGRRTVIVGAGAGGQQALSMIQQDSTHALAPVGFVDDDPSARRLSLQGLRVLGTVHALPEVVRDTDAEVVLLAIPSATPDLVQRVIDGVEACRAELLVLPSFDELLSAPRPSSAARPRPGGSKVDLPRQAFRPVLLEDLLGRGTVETDTDGIRSYLRGKVVLVTGAGGSIGSQLCREIARFEPARLVMTDRDDSLLHAVQLSVDGQGMLDSEDLVLGDLRTPGFVPDLITRVAPDVVFHAAAIKHLTLAERFPTEAFLTNVVGTADLLRACAECGVDRFINISTDKAADPTSVLGYTKRIAERLTATIGSRTGSGTRYISVRFGNVLGSRGSALTTFAAQLSSGQPLTITSPDMTRYFMTVHEACRLVLQAAVDGATGDGLVLDMGESHNIEQLARRFAALQGFPPPTIVYTGVRPGEKLEERTLARTEPDDRPFHPLISRVFIPSVSRELLIDVARMRSRIASASDIESPELIEWLANAAADPDLIARGGSPAEPLAPPLALGDRERVPYGQGPELQ